MISSVARRAQWPWLISLALPLGCAPALPPAPVVARPTAALPPAPRPPPEERVLPSGLRVVIDRDPTSHLVAVVTVVRAGASVEPAGKSGSRTWSST